MNSVLIIDDNQQTLKFISELIKADGNKAYTAESADLAITFLQNTSIDLILLDIALPVIDGFTLFSMIKEMPNCHELPIIFISAYDDKENILQALRLGAEDYVIKPFDNEELLLRIHKQLNFLNFKRNLLLNSNDLKFANETLNHEIIKYQKSESELTELSRKQATLLKNLPGIAYRCKYNRSYTMEFISDGCFELTGYSPLEIIDDLIIPFSEIIHPDDRESVNRAVDHTLDKHLPFELNYRIITKDKAIKWVWEKGQFIYDNEDRIIAIEGLINDISSKMELQEALDDSKTIFNLFLDYCPIYVFFRDENLRIYKISKNFEKLLKLPSKMIIGKTLDQLFEKDFADKMTYEDLKVLNEYQTIALLEEYDGRIFETIKFPIVLENHKKYIAGFSTDITDRKAYEKNLIESEEKFSKAFMSSPYAILITDPFNGQIIEFNEEFKNLSEYSYSEIKNKTTFQLNIWPDYHVRNEFVKRLINSNKVRNEEIKLRTKSGKYLSCLINAELVTLKSKTLIITSINDITEKLKSERELKENEARFRQIIDNSLDGFFRTDKLGRFSFVNTAQVEMLGYADKNELLKTPISSVIKKTSDLRVIFDDIKENGNVKDKTIEVQRKGGTTFWISINGYFYFSESGKVEGIECFVRDVTNRKKLEVELIESESKHRLRSENSSDVIWILEVNFLYFSYVSPAIYKLCGYTPEEFISLPLSKTLSIKSLNKISNLVEGIKSKHLKGEYLDVYHVTELVLNCKDGRKIITEIATTVLFDDNKNITGILGNTRDISARKQTELNIKKKVKIEKALLSISSKFIRKEYSIIIEVFNYALKMIGMITNGDIVFYQDLSANSNNFRLFFWGSDPNLYNFELDDSINSFLNEKLKANNVIKSNDVAFNDELLPESLKTKAYIFIPIFYGNDLSAVIGILGDNPQKKWNKSDYRLLKVVGELISSELFKEELENKRIRNEVELTKLRLGVDQSANSILITDTEGNIVYVNPAFEKMSGYSSDDAIGKNARILKTGHTTQKEYEFMWNTIKNGQKWSGEFLNKKKNGDVFWELASITPVKNSNNEIINFIAIKEDITQRKTDEDNLIYTNRKLEILSEFYYSLNFSVSENDLLKAISHALSNLENYDLVGLYSITYDKNELTSNLIYYYGVYSDLLFQIENDISEIKNNHHPLIDSIKNKQALVFSNLESEWVYNELNLNNSEFLSLYAAPIIYFGKVKYYLVILSEKRDLFTEKELLILDDLNNFLTLGIDLMNSKVEKYRIEEAMEKEKEEMNITLSSINDAVITLNKYHNVILINQAGKNIFDINEHIINHHISNFFKISLKENSKEILNKYNKLINNENPDFNYETVIINTANNNRKIININSIALIENSSSDSRLVLSFRDITERIKLENQLSLAQKMDSVGQLAAGIAHEMNTPLQYVGNNTMFLNDAYSDLINYTTELEFMIERYSNISTESEYLKILNNLMKQFDIPYLKKEIPIAINDANNGIQKVSKIINAMKNFAHPSGSEKSNNNINEALETIMTISKNEWKYSLDINLNLNPVLPLIYCAIDEINQVILNMIINGTHAIQEKFKDSGEMGLITLSTYIEENFAVIEIKDNGIGMSNDILVRIFDPFFTTKEIGKGTGQGLSISHNIIINRHNGLIEVESAENEGTIFKIKLPLNGN